MSEANRENSLRVHIYVEGRVQGVGFRWFVIETIRGHFPEVKGWVKNLYDGRVEVLAEGDSDQLEKLISKIERGPRSAHVANVQVHREPARGGLFGFDVTY